MTEMANSLDELLMERKYSVDELLKKRFLHKTIDKELFFQSPDGMVFTVGTFRHFRSLLIEWADSFEKASGGREDGNMYSIELTEEEMYQAMLEEIEG